MSKPNLQMTFTTVDGDTYDALLATLDEPVAAIDSLQAAANQVVTDPAFSQGF